MGGFGGANMGKMMKQVQEMQQKMANLQAELEEREFEASAGGGMVTARVNGRNEVLMIEIKPEVVDPDDVEMLQDLVLAACNEAIKAAQDTVNSEIGKLSGSFKLPNMPGIF